VTEVALPVVTLIPSLSDRAAEFWELANKSILWGWKRDNGYSSRLVFYSGRLARRRGNAVGVTDQHLLYVHRTTADVARDIASILDAGRADIEAALGPLSVSVRAAAAGHAVVEARAGVIGPSDETLTRRLRRRRPRRAIAAVPATVPRPLEGLARLLPADLYIGSGVSYEAGLPTLCEMHDAFCVDDPSGTRFAHGRDDQLPAELATGPTSTVSRFCQVHTGALTAEPTRAMRVIADLYASGLIGEIYTDNVDNLIAKTGAPFVRTRGSGVLNERCEVAPPSPRLIVVGVAADRRDVVAQARARRRQVIVVNPCERVAPHVRHLTYLKESDVFFKTTADAFFGQLARDLGAAAPGRAWDMALSPLPA
jgi:hypothetical protein